MKFGIGQPLKRKEDNKFLTGNGSYTDDLNFKDLAHMYIIRSPFAFAKINNIDISKANNLRGIYNIINYTTVKDLGINPMLPGFTVKNIDGKDMKVTSRNILASNKVRYVGQPVLAIIADKFETAEEAADLIYIDYEELLSVFGVGYK